LPGELSWRERQRRQGRRRVNDAASIIKEIIHQEKEDLERRR
jgi:hypothetical protein